MAFKDILGQEIAKRILTSAIKNNKISTGYLFYGPEGVGKTLTAKTYAKALNCEQNTGDCCDVCRSCKSIANLTNSDFDIVELLEEKGKKKKNISIDQIRNIKVKYSSHSALLKHRISIIEKADLLSDDASNAFLKILEEPPLKSVFILTTSKVNDILPTIRSRCQEVRFRKLRVEEIEEYFAKNESEAISVMTDKPKLPLQLAGGSIAHALKLFEADFQELRKSALTFINSSSIERMKMVGGFTELDIKGFLSCIQGLYRDLLVKKIGASEQVKNSDLQLEKKINSELSILDGIKLCEEGFDAVERSVNKNLVLYKLAKELP